MLVDSIVVSVTQKKIGRLCSHLGPNPGTPGGVCNYWTGLDWTGLDWTGLDWHLTSKINLVD